MQPGDVPMTYACVDELIAACDSQPSTSLEDGTGKFVHWHKNSTKESSQRQLCFEE